MMPLVQTAFCYRCSAEQGEGGAELELEPTDPKKLRTRCKRGTGCARGCGRCGCELVAGVEPVHAEIVLGDSDKELASWCVCSAACAYLLGMRHARELINRDQEARAELHRARNRAWHSAASNPRRRARGGRA